MLLVGIGLFHHLAPNPTEEQPRGGGILVVVHTGGIEVDELLVEVSLAEADLLYLGLQVTEVVVAQESAVLHALLVEHIAANGVLAQHTRSPLAELNALDAVCTEASSDNGIETADRLYVLRLVLQLRNQEFYHAVSYLTFPCHRRKDMF